MYHLIFFKEKVRIDFLPQEDDIDFILRHNIKTSPILLRTNKINSYIVLKKRIISLQKINYLKGIV